MIRTSIKEQVPVVDFVRVLFASIANDKRGTSSTFRLDRGPTVVVPPSAMLSIVPPAPSVSSMPAKSTKQTPPKPRRGKVLHQPVEQIYVNCNTRLTVPEPRQQTSSRLDANENRLDDDSRCREVRSSRSFLDWLRGKPRSRRTVSPPQDFRNNYFTEVYRPGSTHVLTPRSQLIAVNEATPMHTLVAAGLAQQLPNKVSSADLEQFVLKTSCANRGFGTKTDPYDYFRAAHVSVTGTNYAWGPLANDRLASEAIAQHVYRHMQHSKHRANLPAEFKKLVQHSLESEQCLRDLSRLGFLVGLTDSTSFSLEGCMAVEEMGVPAYLWHLLSGWLNENVNSTAVPVEALCQARAAQADGDEDVWLDVPPAPVVTVDTSKLSTTALRAAEHWLALAIERVDPEEFCITEKTNGALRTAYALQCFLDGESDNPYHPFGVPTNLDPPPKFMKNALLNLGCFAVKKPKKVREIINKDLKRTPTDW